MKIWIVLLSLLAAAAVWHWGLPPRYAGRSQGRGRSKRLVHSLVAGAAVYFSVMSVVALYLMLTHR